MYVCMMYIYVYDVYLYQAQESHARGPSACDSQCCPERGLGRSLGALWGPLWAHLWSWGPCAALGGSLWGPIGTAGRSGLYFWVVFSHRADIL